MEDHGCRPDETKTGRRFDSAVAAALFSRRTAALRTGEMVSRRIAAALGLELLLAARWATDLVRSRAVCRRARDLLLWLGRSQSVCLRAGRAAGPGAGAGDPGL